MRVTEGTPERVLVPLVVVLLLGVVTAAVQAGDDPSGESVGQAPATAPATSSPAPSRSPSATPTASTTSPATTPPSSQPVPPPTSGASQPPATSSPTAPPPSSPTSSPTPTPSSTPFERGEPTTGMTTLDGVRLQVDVDRSAAQVGDVVQVTTTVTNTRSTAIVYTAACPTRVSVRAATGANGTPSESVTGDRRTFKDLALANLINAGNTFVPAAQLAAGSSGAPATCTPGTTFVDLAPGRTIVEKQAWRAATAYGSAYDAQAPVTAGFTFALERAALNQKPELSTVSASAPLRLVGGGASLVPPTVAVDAALDFRQFGEFVEEGDSAVWEPPYPAGSTLGASVALTRDSAGTAVYTVKLVRPDKTMFVQVDGDTGVAIGIVTP